MESRPQKAEGGASALLNLNFRRVRLETVLDHLHKFAGLPIGIKSDVQVERTIDLWHDQAVTAAEALSLLKHRLLQMGCTLIHKGAIFRIIRIEDAKKSWIALPAI